MSRSLLQLVLRTAADADGSDPDLLRRFVASRDEAAFAALVRRHGPLVWAVCRHLIPNRADAEDAFQATFLALAKSAKSVRKPEHLAGWLHGAAVRIAGKAKRGFARRTVHEQKTARPEADTPVAASSWNEMLAAVHDEVAKLPRSLRAAFVLCDLEGVDAADAAGRLGVKANTLSGQLARARQRLLDALTKRGIGAATVTIGTAVAVPQALADKAVGAIGVSPAALNPTVIELASEVTAMKLSNLKLLAAGLMLTCGLSLTGLGLLPKAEGQPPAGPGGRSPGGLPGEGGPGLPPPKALPESGSPDGGGEGGMFGGMMGGPGGMMGGAPKPSAAFEYLFVAKPGTLPEVASLMRNKATQNWEYTGPLEVDPSDPKATPPKATEGFERWTKDTRVVLVFKRAAKPAPPGMGGMGGGGMMPGGMGMGGMSGPGGLGAGGGGMTPGVAGMGAPGGMAPGMGGPGGGGGSKPDTGLAKLLDPLFTRLDKNGDGKLTGDEMPKGLKDTYRLYDKNTDDAVSRTEFAEYLVKVLGADPGSVPGMAGAVGGEGGGGVTAVNNASGQVTVVYKLRHVNATAELVGLIRTHYADARGQKTSEGLAISGDTRNNSLVVSGSQGTVDLVRGIIDTLDVKPADREKPKVYSAMFKITEVAPSEAAVALNAFFRMQDGVNSVGADPFTTLIINAPTASVLDDVRRWVKEKYPKAEEVKAGAGGR